MMYAHHTRQYYIYKLKCQLYTVDILYIYIDAKYSLTTKKRQRIEGYKMKLIPIVLLLFIVAFCKDAYAGEHPPEYFLGKQLSAKRHNNNILIIMNIKYYALQILSLCFVC